MLARFSKNISNSHVKINKIINKQLPPQFFKINLKDTSSFVSINSLGLSPRLLLSFLSNLSQISHPGREDFQVCSVQILRKCTCKLKKLNLYIFMHYTLSQTFPQDLSSSPLPPPQTEGNYLFLTRQIFFLRICFPPAERGQGETMIYFIKIQSENMKMTWNISLFIFSVICNFFRCDDFLIIKHSQHCMVLILLFSTLEPNVTLKLHQKKNSYFDDKDGFLLADSPY